MLFVSCQRKEHTNSSHDLQVKELLDTEEISSSDERSNNYDWLTEYAWMFESGHFYPTYNFLIFRKLEIPPESVLYQERLRRERFSLMYQINDTDKLYTLEYSWDANIYDLEFKNNLTILSINMNGFSYSLQNRAGEQENPKYPLVGIWGALPNLTEYRLIDPMDCMYYMEITEPDIGMGLSGDSAERMGTYLLRQTGHDVFETVSSFPDGLFRLQIMSDRQLVLTPLFTLPADEEGSIARRNIINRVINNAD